MLERAKRIFKCIRESYGSVSAQESYQESTLVLRSRQCLYLILHLNCFRNGVIKHVVVFALSLQWKCANLRKDFSTRPLVNVRTQ